MDMLVGGFVLIIAYLLGSIPFGLLLAKYTAGIDITKQGSGNIGATNVVRICGKRLGLITFALDALKGAVAVWIALWLGDTWLQSLAGLAVVLGHMYPCWLQFKGGKGVATTMAVYGVLYWPLLAFAALCWAVSFWGTRVSSLSSLMAMILSLVVAWVYAPTPVSLVATVINLLVIYRHKENILRLLRGDEGKLA
jgi:acyl phosphate:glycerol-3-phosphate acyltransferase